MITMRRSTPLSQQRKAVRDEAAGRKANDVYRAGVLRLYRRGASQLLPRLTRARLAGDQPVGAVSSPCNKERYNMSQAREIAEQLEVIRENEVVCRLYYPDDSWWDIEDYYWDEILEKLKL